MRIHEADYLVNGAKCEMDTRLPLQGSKEMRFYLESIDCNLLETVSSDDDRVFEAWNPVAVGRVSWIGMVELGPVRMRLTKEEYKHVEAIQKLLRIRFFEEMRDAFWPTEESGG